MKRHIGMNKAANREQELSTVIRENSGALLSAIRRQIRDQVEAQDIMQDVFEEYIEAYDLGLAIETLGAWLIRVAQNKIIDRFRRKKTRDDYQATVDKNEQAKSTNPEDDFVRLMLQAELVEALEQLPPDQLLVFVRHELEGKSFEEISAETGDSVNTLLSRKRYAVQFLREYLKEAYDALE